MGIKTFLLLIFCVGCAPEVKVPSELKNASALNKEKLFKPATALKINNTYTLSPYGSVSKYSAKGPLRFFETMPNNTPINVMFIGGVGNNEVIIEEIKKAP